MALLSYKGFFIFVFFGISASIFDTVFDDLLKKALRMLF